jgi:oxygen-dependent protoporphyrinogen oxidase
MKQIDTIIIGAGLTGLSTGFFLKNKNEDFLILEEKGRAGGAIKTIKTEGFCVETGPNTGTLSTTEIVEFFDMLDECELEVAKEGAKKRLIWKNGKWSPLPYNLTTAIFTPLFSLKDKFRILFEPFRKRAKTPFESVAQLTRRRLGKSFFEYAIDPFISGIYAGDPEKLITKFALPKLYNLEYTYGSLILGGVKKSNVHKTELEKRANRKIFSVKGGLSNLINNLTSEIGSQNIELNVSSIIVKKLENSYLVKFKTNSGEEEVKCKNLVSTIPAYRVGEVFPFIKVDNLSKIKDLLYPKVVEVVVGYKKWTKKKLDAFGGLVPAKENEDVLGALFLSSIFDSRAPKNAEMITYFIGGVRKPHLTEKSDDEIKQLISNYSIKMFGMKISDEDLVHITRHDKAIPQYTMSSKERFEAIEKIEQEHKGLYIRGNIINGISMADRVKQSKMISEMIQG